MGFHEYRLDMWGLGSMFASMIFRKEPFFHGVSLEDQLRKISQVLGTETMNDYIENHGSDYWRQDVEQLGYCPPRAWSSFVNEDNQHLASDEAFDLVDKLLKFEPGASSPFALDSYLRQANLTNSGPNHGRRSSEASVLPGSELRNSDSTF